MLGNRFCKITRKLMSVTAQRVSCFRAIRLGGRRGAGVVFTRNGGVHLGGGCCQTDNGIVATVVAFNHGSAHKQGTEQPQRRSGGGRSGEGGPPPSGPSLAHVHTHTYFLVFQGPNTQD
jgi:hypothetical protein